MKTTLHLKCYGPHHLSWYEAKGLPYREVTEKNRFTESGYLTRKVYDKKYAFGSIQYFTCKDDYNLSSEWRPDIAVPMMEASSWNSFSEFLRGLTVESDLVSLDYLVSLYEEQTGEIIVWFEQEEVS